MENNSEKNKVVTEHIEICRSNDRFIYIQRNKEFEVVGLNYCQGVSDFLNLHAYLRKDETLTMLYKTAYQVIVNMIAQDAKQLEIDVINEVIDIHIQNELR